MTLIKKKQKQNVTSIGKEMEKFLEPLYIADGNVKWHRYGGKQLEFPQ